MFNNKNKELEQKYRHDIEDLKVKHMLEMKQKDWELEHIKDKTIDDYKKKLTEKDIELATIKKENEMLHKITDLNADIIDVKDLINKVVDKLPEIKLNSLNVTSK